MMRQIILFIAAAVITASTSAEAWALDKSKITAIDIKREYIELIGMVEASNITYKVGNKNCSIEAIPLYDSDNIGVGDTMDLKIVLTANDGYDFSWLKLSSCTSKVGEVIDLELSKDKRKATLLFTADPLPIQLEKPIGLQWDGDLGRWNEVKYATSYEVSVYEILSNGKLSAATKTISTTKLRINLKDATHSRPGDYVFSVQALGDKKESYISKSSKATLDYDKSLMITKDMVGYYGGNWQIIKKGKKYAIKREDRETNGSKYLLDGRFFIEGEYYCFDFDGIVLTGWQQYDGVCSYHTANGKAKIGWYKEKENTYYLDSGSGIMVSGWLFLSGKRYYFSESGTMLTGWHKIESDIYYFKKDGSAQTNRMVDTNGKSYDFETDGRLIR